MIVIYYCPPAPSLRSPTPYPLLSSKLYSTYYACPKILWHCAFVLCVLLCVLMCLLVCAAVYTVIHFLNCVYYCCFRSVSYCATPYKQQIHIMHRYA